MKREFLFFQPVHSIWWRRETFDIILFYVRFGFESVSNRDENVLRRTQRTLIGKES